MRRIAIASIIMFVVSVVWATDLVVSKDRWPTTPGAAIEKIHGERLEGECGAWTVKFKEGMFAVDRPIVFEEIDSGLTEDVPIVFEGVQGKTILSGGKRLTGWTEDGDGVWSAPLHKSRSGAVDYFEMLWVNGRRVARAPFPKDKDGINPTHVELRSPGTAAVEFGEESLATLLSGVSADEWPWVQMHVHQIWGFARVVPQGYDAKTHEILAKPPEGKWGGWRTWNKQSRMSFENIRSAFTEPGEWFYDARAQRVRYRPLPDENVPDLEIVAPTPGLSQLLVFRGNPKAGRYVRNVVFRNLIFEYCDSPQAHTNARPSHVEAGQAGVWSSPVAAIDLFGAKNVRFENCTVRHTGGYGIRISDGCSQVTVSYCDFRDLGCGGALVGEWIPREQAKNAEWSIGRFVKRPDRPTSVYDISIQDCTFVDGGYFNPEGVGVCFTHVSDSAIVHNDISEFSYSGINCGWVWGYSGSVSQRNTIAFNRVHNVGRGELDDMGGIYLLGTAFGTCVSNNVIENVQSRDHNAGWGLYTDEGSEGITIENNLVVCKGDSGFHQNYGADNVIRNNILVFGGRGGGVICERDTFCQVRNSFALVNNIIVSVGGAPHVTPRGERPFGVWANNVWWSPEGTEMFSGRTWKEWCTMGREVNSIYADPLFVDFQNSDYRLKPNSPAFKLGFREWDMSFVGPQRERRQSGRP